MGILQDLPTQEALEDILNPVLGDGVAGTGVAGVLNLLEEFDISNLSTSLVEELDQAVLVTLPVNTDALTDGVFDQFQQVMTSFPNDPAALIEPLAAKLETIKSLSSADLSKQLLGGIDGLQNIETIVPANTDQLVVRAAESLTQLKNELISGEFGELRKRSDRVQSLYGEIQPLITSGEGTNENWLINFLEEKTKELSFQILPGGDMAIALTQLLDSAIKIEQIQNIQTLKIEIIEAMNLAQGEFENGNFTNTTHFLTAQAKFEQLTQVLVGINVTINHILEQEISKTEGISRTLGIQFEDFGQIEIVDLGSIKVQFISAIENLEEATKGLDLEVVRETIEVFFKQIDESICNSDIGELANRLSTLQEELQSVLDTLDGALLEAVASIRKFFMLITETLCSIVESLGYYDEDEDFHFYIQDEIEVFINGIKDTIQISINASLEEFKSKIEITLKRVQDALNAVKNEIETVQMQLRESLEKFNDQLENLDVEATMEVIREQLERLLAGLDVIDFDPIVDPVVAQINEMQVALKKIDTSSLNEFTREALKVAADVVVDIDFTSDITDALMNEFDQLIAIPINTLDEIESDIETVLQEFSKLAPEALLSPLDNLFDPVQEHLENLDLKTLIEPVDAWHENLSKYLDQVSPTTLLQPLVDLHTELVNTYNTVSPEELIRPLQEAIDLLKSEILSIDLIAITIQLEEMVERIKGLLDEISPETLLNPLINTFDKIMLALENFDPNALLEPFFSIFNILKEPLVNLTDEQTRLIDDIFDLLRNMIEALDPQYVFQVMREQAAKILQLFQQLNIGGLIADLQGPHNNLQTAFQVNADSEYGTLSSSIDKMNPLRNEAIVALVADYQRFQSQLIVLSESKPSTDLINRYEEIKPWLESLVPAWAKNGSTSDSILLALEMANPLNIGSEISQRYEAFKEQVRNSDPRILRDQIQTSFNQVSARIFTLDPQTIITQVQVNIDATMQQLDQVNLQLIVDELENMSDKIEAIITDLNPELIIENLQGLIDELDSLLMETQPSDLLGGLEDSIEIVKETSEAFSPEYFEQSLVDLFSDINSILERIDLSNLILPVINRLEELRDELEEDLNRTATAFNSMLRAIPL